MTIYLYVKIHKITGLKYLGKTTKDPFKYLGSGIDWRSHLKEHGSEHTTVIIKECKTNKELSNWGRYYSELWNVGRSTEWANRIPETGGGANHTPERKELFRQQQLGRKKPRRTEEHKKNISKSCKGKSKPRTQEHQQALTKSIKQNWANNKERRKKTAAVGLANKGRKQSLETAEKKRLAMLRYWEQKRSQEF